MSDQGPDASPAAVPVLRGRIVILRGPQAGDEAERLAAGRDPEAIRLYGGDYHNVQPFTAESAARWFEQFQQATREDANWVIDVGGRAVGNAWLRVQDSNVQQRSARFRIGIFNRDYWDRGLGTEATRLVLRFGFEELNLHRIELRVIEYNLRAIRSYEKAGFIKEGIERETVFLDGQWHSDVRMAILEDEYKALSER